MNGTQRPQRDTSKATEARKKAAARRRFPSVIEELKEYGFEVIDRDGFLKELA